MTDRKMLEFAAKAAGYNMAKVLDGYPMYMENYGIWNPLIDDGDALRLAARLGIDLEIQGELYGLTSNDHTIATNQNDGEYWEPSNPDPYAATRRAIVRAAAEIGRGIAQHAARTDLPEDNYYKSMAEAEEIGRAAAEIGRQMP